MRFVPSITPLHHGIRRRLRAFSRLPGMRGFLVVLIVFGALLALAVAAFAFRYEHPDGRDIDVVEAAYAVFSLLFFGGGYPWPNDPLLRVLFFLVPLVGLAVVGQIIAGLAGVLLDRERWEVAMASTYEGHIIVCGLGRVGFRVLQWLVHLKETVVLIESDAEHEMLDQARDLKVPVIIGDGRRPQVLEAAGLAGATSIVPCTNDDLINLSVATAARALRPDIRVVLRTFDENLAANLETGFGIYFAYSTSALAAPAFAAAAMSAPVDHAFTFGRDMSALITITEFTIVERSGLAGLTVHRLEREHDVEVLAVVRDEPTLNPPDDFEIQVDDRVVVSAPIDAMSRLGAVTPPSRELRRYLEAQATTEPAEPRGPRRAAGAQTD